MIESIHLSKDEQAESDARLAMLSELMSAALRGGMTWERIMEIFPILQFPHREFALLEKRQRAQLARAARTNPPFTERQFRTARRRAGDKKALTAEYLKCDVKTVRKYWNYWETK